MKQIALTRNLGGRALSALTIVTAALAVCLICLALVPRAEGAIGRANLDGTGIEPGFVTTPPDATPLDVAVDAGHVYWTWSIQSGGSYEGWIGRANLDGTDVQPKFIAGVGYGGLAVSADHIYWVDSDAGTIGRANLDGSGVDPDFIAAIGERAFDIEVGADQIFWGWTSENGGGPRLGWIGRANLDGTGADSGLIGPISYGSGSLAVGDGHIYWGAGTEVFRANLDGSGAPACASPVDPCTPAFLPVSVFDLAVDDAHVYFSGFWPGGRIGYFTAGIGRANLDGTGTDLGFTPAPNNPVGLAVGAGHIYWTGGPPPPSVDGSATARPTQRCRGTRIHVAVKVKAEEALTATVSGKLKAKHVYKLKPKTAEVTAGEVVTLVLKPRRKGAAKRIAAALQRGRKPTAKLEVKLTDRTGSSTSEKLTVRLKR